MSKLKVSRYSSLPEGALLKLVNQGNEEAKEELARRITSRIRQRRLPSRRPQKEWINEY